MKRLILACIFMLVAFAAFSQSPEDRANYLVNEVSTLITDLKPIQKVRIKKASLRFFEEQAKLSAKVSGNSAYGSYTPDQETINRVNEKKAQLKANYKELMKERFSPAQYAIFTQNLDAILQRVVAEFGE